MHREGAGERVKREEVLQGREIDRLTLHSAKPESSQFGQPFQIAEAGPGGSSAAKAE